jgi:HSP20 family molecular chaperone IbpA
MDILQFHTLFLPQFQVPLIFQFSSIAASISSEREPLADVTTTDKEVKVIAEMPGVNKENIKVNVYDNSLEVTTTGTEERKYREVIEIPAETDIETAKSAYKIEYLK